MTSAAELCVSQKACDYQIYNVIAVGGWADLVSIRLLRCGRSFVVLMAKLSAARIVLFYLQPSRMISIVGSAANQWNFTDLFPKCVCSLLTLTALAPSLEEVDSPL